MARVTVEDCLENVANRFELVMVASKRARQIGHRWQEIPWCRKNQTSRLSSPCAKLPRALCTNEILRRESEMDAEEELADVMEASEALVSAFAGISGTSHRSDDMQTLDALNTTLRSYLNPEQANHVNRAYFFAEQAHYGQRRRSGEPYVTHPLAVAGILADMHMDHQSLMAAMLHDVIEDTGIEKSAIGEQFGPTVAELVDGVSKLTQMEFQSLEEKQAENFQKMALAMAQDIRVILVKLADRLHNMRTLGVLKSDKARRIARETLDIYSPIAMRLGMNTVRMEFEDLGFSALYPMRASRIDAALRQARGHRKELVEKVRHQIEVPWNRRATRFRGGGPRKAPVQHLQENEIQAEILFRDHGYLCLSHHRGFGRHLLSRAGLYPQPVQTGTRRIQGLHRHSQSQWLSIPAHGR